MTEKMRIIVTVIAILEMAKNKAVSIQPMEGIEDILIKTFGELHLSAAVQ
jgi:chromatin segregation and condensation protein Rec8/ScpA/Scc1 (kleisin family)